MDYTPLVLSSRLPAPPAPRSCLRETRTELWVGSQACSPRSDLVGSLLGPHAVACPEAWVGCESPSVSLAGNSVGC